MQWATGTNFAIRHTMAISNSKEQQAAAAAAAAATSVLHSSRDVCTNTYSYVVQQRTAQYVSNDPY